MPTNFHWTLFVFPHDSIYTQPDCMERKPIVTQMTGAVFPSPTSPEEAEWNDNLTALHGYMADTFATSTL